MAKNKKNNTDVPAKQAGKGRQRLSGTKLKQDGKAKTAKEEDHFKDIPFRLREIMKSRDRMKAGPFKSKKPKEAVASKNKEEETRAGDIPVPHFKRGKKESVKSYLRRMDIETGHVLFLTKNQVERKPELAESKQERPADKGKSEKKKEHDKERLQRLQLKKWDKQETMMEKEMFVDHVPFGEVTLAPPTLTSKPKKAPVRSQSAPKGLLLNSLMGNTVASTAKPSMARQRIMEEERVRAVEAYRHLKKQKQRQREAMAVSQKKKPKIIQ